ncbi:hypothetical protein V490_00024 [Pseudogymnoascus sp. VKM F-3557]|nr:hypothetical protein V490_00024 [Pseudogymnoascus sp. VKM F-3557]
MLTFRNEKQRLRYLRCTSSGPIILQDPRNGNISGTSTSDLESLEKEMERLRLQAQVTPKATATTMAHRRGGGLESLGSYSVQFTVLAQLLNGPGFLSSLFTTHLKFLLQSATTHSHLGLAILPIDVKLITKPEDLYQWSILTAGKAALFNKQLSKHSTGAYIDLCSGVGVHFKAVLAEGAANYEQEMPLVTKSTAFDAPDKSREHPSRDIITFQLSVKEWRERFNEELAIREALEIEMIRIKGENAELLPEMKALREEEARRIQELEKAREVLLITSRILQERASKASEDSQKITHAATSLKLGSNPFKILPYDRLPGGIGLAGCATVPPWLGSSPIDQTDSRAKDSDRYVLAQTLLKNAGAMVQAQKYNITQSRNLERSMSESILFRALAGKYVISSTSSTPNNTPTATPSSGSQSSHDRRHVHFNNEVEHCYEPKYSEDRSDENTGSFDDSSDDRLAMPIHKAMISN